MAAAVFRREAALVPILPAVDVRLTSLPEISPLVVIELVAVRAVVLVDVTAPVPEIAPVDTRVAFVVEPLPTLEFKTRLLPAPAVVTLPIRALCQ